MKSQIFLLKVNTAVHSFFTICSILTVVLFSFGIHNTVVDTGGILTFFSFLFFKRCILIDIHQYLQKDLIDLPYSAQDSFTRDMIKNIVDSIFNGDIGDKIDLKNKSKIQNSRMDILINIEPLHKENDISIIQDMHNRKIQYIAGNLIVGGVLMAKYNIKWLPAFLIIWVLNTFPL